jgi:hypothetical protein
VIQGRRRIDLLKVAIAEHGDAVAHCHRFDLVVRDIHGRHREALLELDQLGAGLDPKLGVEVRERLVHQVDLRVADDRPTHRDPLPLSAGEIAWLPVEVRLEVEQLRNVEYPPHALLLRHALLLEREAHVLGDVEVRVERVILEHHGDVPVTRPHL